MALIKPDDRRKHDYWGTPLPATMPHASALRASIGKLAAGLLYLVDSAIPFEMRQGDPVTGRRARIIMSFTLALIVLGLETGVFFSRFLDPEATLRVEFALVLGLSLTALIPLVLRRLRSLALATNLLISAAYIVTIAVF